MGLGGELEYLGKEIRMREIVGERILRWVKNFSKGPRPAGNEKVAWKIYHEFSEHCKQTRIFDFKFHPNAFLGYLVISTPIILFGAINLFYHNYALSLVSWILFGIIVVAEFIFYKELLDPLFKEKRGHNVVGSVVHNYSPKKIIIISAHHDSARIFRYLSWPILYLTLMIGYTLTFFGGLILIPICWICNLHLVATILAITTLAIHPFFFFFLGKGYTPGHGDNLVSVGILIELMRYFKDNPIKGINLLFCSFDGEESGLRGSRHFVKELLVESCMRDIEVINLESFYNLEDLAVTTCDLNGTLKTNRELKERILAQLRKYYPAKTFPVTLGTGATDAATFLQAGIPAVTILGIGAHPTQKTYYHTKDDTVEHIDYMLIEIVYNSIRNYIIEESK